MIEVGKTVKLYDYTDQREISIKVVRCSYKYRFVGRDFNSIDYKFMNYSQASRHNL